MSWQRIDGRTSLEHTSDVSSLRPVARDLKTLNVNMMLKYAADGLKQLLREPLPYLEQLRIQTIPGYDEQDSVRIYWPPMYPLNGVQLPRLHTVMAIDTQVDLGMSLCGNLRHLHLQFSDPGYDSFHLPMAHFLHIVRNCPRLQSLYVDRYIDASTPARTLPPQVLSLTGHTQLQRVWIRDEPHIVSRILSSLVIPANVNTNVSAYVTRDRPAAALRAMFPDDLSNLQMLGRATGLDVRHALVDGHIYPRFSVGMLTTGPLLDLELLCIQGDDALGMKGDQPDGVLLYAMLASLDILNTLPMQMLRVEGNLQHITLERWRAAFDRFPCLEELEIKDVNDSSMDAIAALLQALSLRSPGRSDFGVVACPLLQRLRLRGVIPGQYMHMLAPAFERLMDRAHFRVPLLRRLEVDLASDSAWDANLVARLKQVLAFLADSVDLKVCRTSDWQY